MQNWDRWALIAMALLTGIYAGLEGRRLWRRGKYMGAVGIGILILSGLAFPLLLALMG